MGERVDRALGRAARGVGTEDGWAAEEFGGAELGDARLTARLVRLVLWETENNYVEYSGS